MNACLFPSTLSFVLQVAKQYRVTYKTMSDVAAVVQEAVIAFGQFKTAFGANDSAKAERLLKDLRRSFVQFPTFMDPNNNSQTRTQEVMLVRETLEHAVLLATRRKDLKAFQDNFHQLRVYYECFNDTTLPKSERFHMILGLNLMRLLVESKAREFHSELETIPHQEHGNMYIKTAMSLERFLMEGSYKKLLNARAKVPSNDFLPLMEMLEETVRSEVALCLPQSYRAITFEAAKDMLMLPSVAAVAEYGAAQGWAVGGDKQSFAFEQHDENATKKEINFMSVLEEQFTYAHELQRIV
jgi:26S proteasome regulatory subunit N12